MARPSSPHFPCAHTCKTLIAPALVAGAMIAICVAAVFEVAPREVAEYSVIAVPALASVSIMTPCHAKRMCA